MKYLKSGHFFKPGQGIWAKKFTHAQYVFLPWNSDQISFVPSPPRRFRCRKVARGSKPPLVTRIARTVLGTRLRPHDLWTSESTHKCAWAACGFSYKHCNFSRVCLLLKIKMTSKTVTRSIESDLCAYVRIFSLMNVSSHYWSPFHANDCVFSRDEQQKV